jgi:hypothetical protein
MTPLRYFIGSIPGKHGRYGFDAGLLFFLVDYFLAHKILCLSGIFAKHICPALSVKIKNLWEIFRNGL